jgi:hypothetical protein
MSQSNTPLYPTRLVDVGSNGDELIRLLDTYNFGNQGPYFCLSHCWGDSQPYVLTKETAPTLRDDLKITELPKTFREAILVTRAFQVRYIWYVTPRCKLCSTCRTYLSWTSVANLSLLILGLTHCKDFERRSKMISLKYFRCIFQDNISDWSTEAQRMRDVYSQAACTIAATASHNHSEGLFFDRDPETLRPRSDLLDGIYLCNDRYSWRESIDKAPLNARAWVAQERYLSPRIMHFCATQLFWECRELKACENYPDGLPSWVLPPPVDDPNSLKDNMHYFRQRQFEVHSASGTDFDSNSSALNDVYRSWRQFRDFYSESVCTKESDKLVAFMGVAQDVGQALKDELVAGLWKSRFIGELCWRKDGNNDLRELTEWRAPTWSWVSINNQVQSNYVVTGHGLCDKEMWSELERLDVETKPSGELVHASVKLRCKPIKIALSNFTIGKFGPGFHGVILKLNPIKIGPEADNDLSLVFEREDAKNPNFDTGLWLDKLVKEELWTILSIIVLQRCPHEDSVHIVSHGEDVHEDDNGVDDYKTIYTSYVESSIIEGLLLAPKLGSETVFEILGYFSTMGDIGSSAVAKVITAYEATETKVITLV